MPELQEPKTDKLDNNIPLGSDETEFIEIYGAREHNLKDIDLKFRRHQLVVIISWWSSPELVAVANLRWLLIPFMPKVKGDIWRVFQLMLVLLSEIWSGRM